MGQAIKRGSFEERKKQAIKKLYPPHVQRTETDVVHGCEVVYRNEAAEQPTSGHRGVPSNALLLLVAAAALSAR